MPYNEAMKKEPERVNDENDEMFDKPSITIWRVIYSLSKIYWPDFYDKVIFCVDIWKLTNEDGSECTDDDQADETIEKLYELIK